jgi:hypothetical protein
MEYLRTNYVVISSAIIALASGLSMLLLSSYLAAFDWNLIWLLEYSDLAKLFLIGIAFVSSSLVTMIWVGQDVHTWLVDKNQKAKWLIWLALLHLLGHHADIASCNDVL